MKDIVNILNTNNYSINLKNDFNNLDKINSYYPTFNNMRLLDKILTSIDNKTNGAILLSGAYGTGKSYFASILLNILNEKSEENIYENLIKKSEKIYNIEDGIKRFQRKKIIPIFIDDSYENFSEGVFSGIKKAMTEYNLNIEIPSSFEIITKKLKGWEEDYPKIYKNFKKKLDEKNFFHELTYKTKKSLSIFEDIYSEIFAGEKFNNSGKIKNITELLQEVEKGILDNGYDGVIYVFDEFGRYLESNITKIDVKEIQDVAEYCNGINNSNFLVITHKELFQYSRKLKNYTDQEEWNKVSGRFLKEHLIYEKNNILKIVKNIIENKNFKLYRKKNKEIKSKEILLDKMLENINSEKITEDFYPFDIVTANVLPDLSQKLAQNERTLFAFVCSNEEKALKNIIKNNKNEYFITLDKLYDYFEKELRQLPIESLEYKIYLTSRNLINKLNSKEILEKKIIKSIALIYINNNFSDIKPDINTLKYIYNDDKLDLEVLENKKIISLKKYQNYYKLVENIDFDLEKEIKNIKENKIGKFDYIYRLEKERNLDVYYPLKYNDNNKIIRYLGQYFLDVSDIARIEKLNKNNIEDGKIIYLTNIEMNKNYNKIGEFLKMQYEDIFICGDSEIQIDILEELKELEAISVLENSNIKYLDNDIIKSELELMKKDIRNALKIKLNIFFNKEIELLDVTNNFLENKYNKYIKINYELINKHNLTSPMKKSRIEILKKIEEKRVLTDEYFNDTKAESSVARILLKNTGLYNGDKENIVYDSLINLKENIILDIKKEKISINKLYEKYCSNKSEYGIREGIFTFILGLVFIENKEYINISLVEENTEVILSLDLLDGIEKNPEKYVISYYEITIAETNYFNKLEILLKEYVPLKEVKISNRILGGIKNYLLNQPRYISNIYLIKLNGLNKIFRGIFTENNGKELILKELLKIYKTEDYNEIILKFQKEMIMLEEFKSEFKKTIEKETIGIVTEFQANDIDELFKILKSKKEKNGIDKFILSLKSEKIDEILKELTKKIKGFSYENWRNLNDFEEYKNELKKEVNIKLKKVLTSQQIKISFNENEEIIDIGTSETVLEKMLSSKIKATIKNMGLSLSDEEKRKILAKILLNI